MSESVIVTISHRLGKEEAKRRIGNGLTRLPAAFGPAFRIHDQTWSGDELHFHVSALAQTVSGIINVADDHVRLEVMLPWLLARLAGKASARIEREGRLMLEKK
jgi:Putative polyhydroxyalkanoic acid system protein (PHA_gran_rgn)